MRSPAKVDELWPERLFGEDFARAFFDHNQHFGLNPDNVFFFQQGMMPAFTMDGKLLLAEQDSLALSPDVDSLRRLYVLLGTKDELRGDPGRAR